MLVALAADTLLLNITCTNTKLITNGAKIRRRPRMSGFNLSAGGVSA